MSRRRLFFEGVRHATSLHVRARAPRLAVRARSAARFRRRHRRRDAHLQGGRRALRRRCRQAPALPSARVLGEPRLLLLRRHEARDRARVSRLLARRGVRRRDAEVRGHGEDRTRGEPRRLHRRPAVPDGRRSTARAIRRRARRSSGTSTTSGRATAPTRASSTRTGTAARSCRSTSRARARRSRSRIASSPRTSRSGGDLFRAEKRKAAFGIEVSRAVRRARHRGAELPLQGADGPAAESEERRHLGVRADAAPRAPRELGAAAPTRSRAPTSRSTTSAASPAIVPQYTWECLGEMDLVAPMNSKVAAYPYDRDHNFGPYGLSYADDRWELRHAVKIRFTPNNADHPYHHKDIYLDEQTLVALYSFAYDRKGELWKIIWHNHRWSGDDLPQDEESWYAGWAGVETAARPPRRERHDRERPDRHGQPDRVLGRARNALHEQGQESGSTSTTGRLAPAALARPRAPPLCETARMLAALRALAVLLALAPLAACEKPAAPDPFASRPRARSRPRRSSASTRRSRRAIPRSRAARRRRRARRSPLRGGTDRGAPREPDRTARLEGVQREGRGARAPVRARLRRGLARVGELVPDDEPRAAAGLRGLQGSAPGKGGSCARRFLRGARPAGTPRRSCGAARRRSRCRRRPSGTSTPTRPGSTVAEPVVGVALGGESRAYPLRWLDWHEVANDALGGRVDRSRLVRLLRVGPRVRRGRGRRRPALRFASSGLVEESVRLLHDGATSTLWNELTGAASLGADAEGMRRLEPLPAVLTTWRAWRERNPRPRCSRSTRPTPPSSAAPRTRATTRASRRSSRSR